MMQNTEELNLVMTAKKTSEASYPSEDNTCCLQAVPKDNVEPGK